MKAEKKIKFCYYCKHNTMEETYFGRIGNIKFFDNHCSNCGYYYIYRLNIRSGKYYRTLNLDLQSEFVNKFNDKFNGWLKDEKN